MLLPSLVLALGALGAQDPSPRPPQLAVQAVRFYAPQAEMTTVLAFVQVPYVLAEPAGDRIAWQTTVVVEDSAGLELLTESWWIGAPAALRIPDAYRMEPLRFPPMKPGNYRITVTVRDSVSGRTASAATMVEAFDTAPAVSDLLLASAMRVVEGTDTMTLPGEMSRGNLRFNTTPDLTLDGLRPSLAFLLEAYSPVEISATTHLEVRRTNGDVVHRLPAFDQTVPAGGGVIKAQFSLEGLSEGDYSLHATVTMGGVEVERSAQFAVGSLEAAMAREIAARNANRAIDEAYFASLSEDQLDDAAEALELLAPRNELAVYKADGDGALSVNAKRRFLTQFWGPRDLDPSTAANETRIAFYDAIAYADNQFAESGRNARPGWKTDRGRVFVKHGIPTDKFVQPSSGQAPPFEIWRYSQGRPLFYIFADRNNFGNYQLVKTNDPEETSSPNWVEVITPQVVMTEIEPYLGQRFCSGRSTMDPSNAGNDAGSASLVCN